MLFTVGANAALAELAKAPIDVVVADMRMPGMDGAALLTKVKSDYPSAACIVLSGHAERDAIMRSLPVAHQFVAKPCDVEVLRTAVERTTDLHRLLTDESIRRLVGKIEALRSAPRLYVALTEAASDPRAGVADFARIIQSDPAMSVKVLQLVNSAYFGTARRIASVQHAVSYLGLELLKGLSLMAQVFAMGQSASAKAFSVDHLQTYSMVASRLARRFFADVERGNEALTAALLHDVGKVILAVAFSDQFSELMAEGVATQQPLHLLERQALGASHAEVGAYLLGMWGLPFSVVESVAYHHTPSGPCDILAAVHAADALLDSSLAATEAAPSNAPLDVAFLERAGFGHELDSWRALAEEEVRKCEEDHVRRSGGGGVPSFEGTVRSCLPFVAMISDINDGPSRSRG